MFPFKPALFSSFLLFTFVDNNKKKKHRQFAIFSYGLMALQYGTIRTQRMTTELDRKKTVVLPAKLVLELDEI